MVLLNGWVLFGLIPLFLIYKRDTSARGIKRLQLLYISLLFMFLAMSRPALPNSYTQEKFDSQDFIIALDVSYSMEADDLQPSRYLAAKEAIKKLFTLHPKDRFTLFAFTSNALLISPPTTDTAVSMMALDALNPQYILTKSTSLEHLFQTVAKLPMKKKNLILLSDGGDEHDVAKLTQLAKQNNIIPYIVATATQKGAALKKDGKYLKNADSSLVISKINPMLQDLAQLSGGKYYELNSLATIEQLSQDISKKDFHKESIQIKSYTELFYIPLFLAAILFILAVTKLQKYLYLLLSLLFLSQSTEASVLDFTYLDNAQKYYAKKEYTKAAQAFSQLTPSVESFYNTAASYYKAHNYKKALSYYTQIQTRRPQLKQNILYNMGNCAAQLKHYDKAKQYYLQALAFGEDKDALYNLQLLQKHRLKTQKNPADMLPKNHTNKTKKQQGTQQKKKNDTKKNMGGSNNAKQSAPQGSQSGSKSKKHSQTRSGIKAVKKLNYKIGYKAYETINKGYTDEKQPW